MTEEGKKEYMKKWLFLKLRIISDGQVKLYNMTKTRNTLDEYQCFWKVTQWYKSWYHIFLTVKIAILAFKFLLNRA